MAFVALAHERVKFNPHLTLVSLYRLIFLAHADALRTQKLMGHSNVSATDGPCGGLPDAQLIYLAAKKIKADLLGIRRWGQLVNTLMAFLIYLAHVDCFFWHTYVGPSRGICPHAHFDLLGFT